MRLADKVAIVTGSGRGIGKAIAQKFAQEKAKVLIVDMDADTAEATAAEIQKAGGQASWRKVDVARETEVRDMVAFALKEFGQIDILVNNAGIVQAAPFLDLTEQDWDAILSINLKGVVFCTKAVVAEMMKRKSGKIINIASRAGKVGVAHMASYCATKFAVVGLTQSNAMEFAPHITVNAICPGIVMTYMWEKYLPIHLGKARGLNPEEMQRSRISSIPMGRPQYAEDVAKVALFLASSDADYITGQAIMDSGGLDPGR
jgi:meso-butanediol dehydrogenase/(S,S)-butanediol dehydrogenase/diacetyl reductase